MDAHTNIGITTLMSCNREYTIIRIYYDRRIELLALNFIRHKNIFQRKYFQYFEYYTKKMIFSILIFSHCIEEFFIVIFYGIRSHNIYILYIRKFTLNDFYVYRFAWNNIELY